MCNDMPWEVIPEGMPVICDMSSCICSESIDWTKYDCVYAGAQKNMGPSGVTVVIVKDSLLNKASKMCPNVLNLTSFVNAPNTFYNTPCTWAIYVCGLNFAYMRA